VINLISNDVQKFEDAGPYANFIWVGPVQAVIVLGILLNEVCFLLNPSLLLWGMTGFSSGSETARLSIDWNICFVWIYRTIFPDPHPKLVRQAFWKNQKENSGFSGRQNSDDQRYA